MHMRRRALLQEMFIHCQIQSKKKIKEEQKCQNEMREQIKKRLIIYRIIKHIIDTNNLNELNDSYF